MMAQTATRRSEDFVGMSGQERIKAWFSEQIQQNRDALYSVALRLTRNRAMAEDLVAESVIKAWTAIGTLDDHDRFRPWLFRIMHNRFLSDCRKRSVRPVETSWSEQGDEDCGREVTNLLLEQPEEFLAWWATPERNFVNRLLGEQIRRAIEELPEAFRMTVLLVNVDGLAYDEAAEVLGVPAGTVRSRMKRGRTMLQKALWQQANEAGLTDGVECAG
jgi:RNA polymerase sigma-70 factor (ECF subfamily)